MGTVVLSLISGIIPYDLLFSVFSIYIWCFSIILSIVVRDYNKPVVHDTSILYTCIMQWFDMGLMAT